MQVSLDQSPFDLQTLGQILKDDKAQHEAFTKMFHATEAEKREYEHKIAVIDETLRSLREAGILV